jgi:GntR family transcriptional repressor for pyruvate dehydrogenase complex
MLAVVGMSTFSVGPVPGRQKLAEQVARALLERIETGGMRPGEKLPSEHELARMLHVGRSTVREALNGLALLGAIEIRHGSGAFVAERSVSDVARLEAALRQGLTQDLLEARLVAEVAMVQLAAVRATDQELAEIERVLSAYERAARAGEPSSRLAATFHVKLLDAAHNDVLSGFVDGYMPQALEQGRWLDDLVQHPDFETAQHRELFEAVRAHDPARAGRLMITHLTEMSHVHLDLLSGDDAVGRDGAVGGEPSLAVGMPGLEPGAGSRVAVMSQRRR